MKKPEDLISFQAVSDAIKLDKGKNFKLTNWSVKPFANKGDNYASYVTSITPIVYNDNNGDEEQLSYVVKLNPCRDSLGWNSIIYDLFLREGMFLSEVAPDLNKVLHDFGQQSLNVPRCFSATYSTGNECLINEDLRPYGYKMINRIEGMSNGHAFLVLKEMAKVHASAYIMEQKSQKKIPELYPYLEKDVVSYGNPCCLMVFATIEGQITNAINILTEIGGYKEAIKKLETLKSDSQNIYMKMIDRTTSPAFTTICHGDCWSNNMVFR